MNKITILDSKLGKLDLEDDVILNQIKRALAFRLEGVEYSNAFRTGAWDGLTYMINGKHQFPIGLLSKVQEQLDKYKVNYEIVDKSKSFSISTPIDLLPKLNQLNKIPRDYQLKVTELIDQNRLGIIRAATGSGKTLIAALMTAKINKPTMILVIGLELLQQFHSLFSEVFDEPIGWIGDGKCDIQRINIASIWSVSKALDISLKDLVVDGEIDEESFKETDKYKIIETLKQTKLFILDECHIATTATIRGIHKVINPEYFYGLSGTPYREDGSDLLIEGLLGPKIIDISAAELIQKGYLVQPWIKFIEVPILKTSGTYASVYKDYIVENSIRNQIVVNQTKSLIEKNYKTLVLFKQIKHGEILAEKFKEEKLRFDLISGRDSSEKRELVKQRLINNEIDFILGSTIYDIGVDIPIANGLVLAGAGKSAIRAYQRIGRVCRTAPGKTLAAVVDFYDQAKYLKNHSLKRHELYVSEPGYKVLPTPF